MKQAIWNGTIIAESAETVVVEGNHYFPAETVNKDYLTPSDKTSFCGWKGDCNYHNVVVDGNERPLLLGTTPILTKGRRRSGGILLSGKEWRF